MYKDYEIKLNAILDKHKQPKRFDFKDIKTLDKLSDLALRIYDDAPEKNDIEMAIDRVDDFESDIIFSKEKLEEVKEYSLELNEGIKENTSDLKDIQSSLKENKQELKDTSKKIKEWTNEVKVATKGKATAYKKASAIVKNAETQVAKAKKTSADLKKAISDFESAAKGLGVDVSSKVSEYKGYLADVTEVANMKFPKIK